MALKKLKDSETKTPKQSIRGFLESAVREALVKSPLTATELKTVIVNERKLLSEKTYRKYFDDGLGTWKAGFLDEWQSQNDKRVKWFFLRAERTKWAQKRKRLVYEGSREDFDEGVNELKRVSNVIAASLESFRRHEILRAHALAIQEAFHAWISVVDAMFGATSTDQSPASPHGNLGIRENVQRNSLPTWSARYLKYSSMLENIGTVGVSHLIADFVENHLHASLLQIGLNDNPAKLHDQIVDSLQEMLFSVATIVTFSSDLCHSWKDGVLKQFASDLECTDVVVKLSIQEVIRLWKGRIDDAFKANQGLVTEELLKQWNFKGGVEETLKEMPFLRPGEMRLFESQAKLIGLLDASSTVSSVTVEGVVKRAVKAGTIEGDVEVLTDEFKESIAKAQGLRTCLNLILEWSDKYRRTEKMLLQFKKTLLALQSLWFYPGDCPLAAGRT